MFGSKKGRIAAGVLAAGALIALSACSSGGGGAFNTSSSGSGSSSDSITVGSAAFGAQNPLWVAQWGTSSPTLPTGWSDYTFWQYTATGTVGGIDADTDESVFPGNHAALVRFADEE